MRIDKDKMSQFVYGDKTYNLFIVRKNIKSFIIRSKNDVIVVSCPMLLSKDAIINNLKIYIPRFIDKYMLNRLPPYSFTENYLYLFGDKKNLMLGDKNLVSDDAVVVKGEKDLPRILKKNLLMYLKKRVEEFSLAMNISPTKYRVSIRNMSTRFGSNSQKTLTLSFQLNLVHFSKDIIDTVVWHELAHDKVHAHNNNFYQLILKYCPNYYSLQVKLKKGIYA